jgi:hypothetical protein
MRSRIAYLAAALALAGCAVEHGNQRAARTGGTDQGAAASPGTAPGPMHSVFARLRDTVALGVERISLSVLLAPEMDRAAQRKALEDVLQAQRKQDSGLAAIRVLGFGPPTAAHRAHPAGMAMIPFVILEWVPKDGWNAVSAANARAPHTTDVQFMADLPVHQRAPGAGAGAGR